MNKKFKFLVACIGVSLCLTGCGGRDVETMTSGLQKSGLPPAQASAFAEALKKGVKKDPYNYLAGLMDAGIPEKDAINKTRRKYGSEFKSALTKIRAEIIK